MERPDMEFVGRNLGRQIAELLRIAYSMRYPNPPYCQTARTDRELLEDAFFWEALAFSRSPTKTADEFFFIVLANVNNGVLKEDEAEKILALGE